MMRACSSPVGRDGSVARQVRGFCDTGRELVSFVRASAVGAVRLATSYQNVPV